ncbi:MAG: hypothetical protein AAGL68_06210 [Pseudomonadota bacterium]
MREALNQWDYVIAAYVIAIGGLLALTIWAWRSMRAAEKRRDEVKRR